MKVVLDKISWCKEMRGADPPQPTVPSTIAEEKLLNPFMRVRLTSRMITVSHRLSHQVREAPVQSHAGQSDPIETMRALRAEKDHFKSK